MRTLHSSYELFEKRVGIDSILKSFFCPECMFEHPERTTANQNSKITLPSISLFSNTNNSTCAISLPFK